MGDRFHEHLKSASRRAADEAARAYLQEHPGAGRHEVHSHLRKAGYPEMLIGKALHQLRREGRITEY